MSLQASSTAVVYFEQGHESLFGDPQARLTPAAAAADAVFHAVMGLPVVLATVSEHARSALADGFGRGRALIVPCGVDSAAFRPCAADGSDDAACSSSVKSGPYPPGSEAWIASGLPQPACIVGLAPEQVRRDAEVRSR